MSRAPRLVSFLLVAAKVSITFCHHRGRRKKRRTEGEEEEEEEEERYQRDEHT